MRKGYLQHQQKDHEHNEDCQTGGALNLTHCEVQGPEKESERKGQEVARTFVIRSILCIKASGC